MRTLFLALILPLFAGCADVEQSIVWLEDGRIAWRWRASPSAAPDLDIESIRAAIVPTGQQVVRAWVDSSGPRTWYVVQARVDGPEAWASFREGLVARVESVTGPIPESWRPPTVVRQADGWRLDHPAREPELGRSQLTVQAPRMHAKAGQPGDADVLLFDGEAPVHAIIEDDKTNPMGLLLQGGPALACALAGLALLMWVNRRTARRIRAGQGASRSRQA